MVVGVFAVGGVGIGGYEIYQQWEGRRLVRRAEVYQGWGDLKSAALTAHRAFQMNHSNVAACRLLASIAERTGQESAIEWRKNAVAAAPQSTEDKIALAKAALQFNRIALAETTWPVSVRPPGSFPDFTTRKACWRMPGKIR